jgi:VWFA-related protein
VLDAQGTPVRGLTQRDFTVLEDGVEQPITTFEAVSPREDQGGPGTEMPTATEPAPEGGSRDASLPPGRTIAIVFDDPNLTLPQGERVKTAVADLLKSHTTAGDEVWLISPSIGLGRGARMPEGAEGLFAVLKDVRGRRVVDRSAQSISDIEAQDIHVRLDGAALDRVVRRFLAQDPNLLFGDPERVKPLVGARAAEVYADVEQRIRMTLAVLESALERLAGRKGRKSLVLASSGFLYDGALSAFRRVLGASLRANTAIYFLDARGLQGLAPFQDVETAAAMEPPDLFGTRLGEGLATQGAEVLVVDTGGFTIRNTNDLAKGLRLIADTSSCYYLIGYDPAKAPRRGEFRKIQVRLNRRAKGLRVMARRGYVAP